MLKFLAKGKAIKAYVFLSHVATFKKTFLILLKAHRFSCGFPIQRNRSPKNEFFLLKMHLP